MTMSEWVWRHDTPEARYAATFEMGSRDLSRHLLLCDHCILAYLAVEADGFCDDGRELSLQAGILVRAA